MTIPVIINGANGRMGQEAVIAIENDTELELVAALGRGDDLAKNIRDTKAKVVVDLTTPEVVYQNTKTIMENGASPVIGTSGFTPAQIEELINLSKKEKIGGLIAPNFSIAAILTMRAAKMAAAYMPDVEIIEYHHNKKIDAPSGTALKTAELINEARKQAPAELPNPNPNARGHMHHDVPIHSLRLPGIVAKEDVIFGAPDETFTISHNSLHRKCFMPGIVFSCKKVVDLHELVYGLDNLL